jgi:hypothetical protein
VCDEKRTGWRNSRIMDGHRPGIRVSKATGGMKNGARYESRTGEGKKRMGRGEGEELVVRR